MESVEEDLRCPVCNKQLSAPEAPPSNPNKSRKAGKNKRGVSKSRSSKSNSTTKAKGDSKTTVGNDYQEIVIAKCGHLFHKFCLKNYCFFTLEGKPSYMSKVNCPWCKMQITSMAFQTVDYRAHQDKTIDRDRDFNKTSIMNNELNGQMKTVDQNFKRVTEEAEGEKHNYEIYSMIQKELKNIEVKKQEINGLYSDIERSEQMFKFMLSQQLKIVRRFIMKAKKKSPNDFIHFPRCLAPFLHIIEKDDKLVRDLGEIIVPIHLNNLNSDRHNLLQGIFAIVFEKMRAQGKKVEMPREAMITTELQLRTSDDSSNTTSTNLTKVCASSASVLSCSNLTALAGNSIQQIVENIDVLFSGSRDAASEWSNRLNNVSTSDMEVLYMPTRNGDGDDDVLTSEFCKTYDYRFEA